MNRQQYCIAILFLITTTKSSGQISAVTNGEYSIRPPDFTKMTSYGEMQAAMASVERMNPKITTGYATDLVRQVQDDNASNESKVCAIYLIGQMRITNSIAIAALIDKIDLKATRMEPALRIKRWGPYPAQEALIKIGAPAAGPVAGRIPTENNDLRRHLMCAVLRDVEGKTEAESRIKRMLVNESDPSRRTNLENALKDF